jgi:hypothetical protein
MIILFARKELRAVESCRLRVEVDRQQLAAALTQSKTNARKKLVELPTLGIIFVGGCLAQYLGKQLHHTHSIASYLALFRSVSSIAACSNQKN